MRKSVNNSKNTKKKNEILLTMYETDHNIVVEFWAIKLLKIIAVVLTFTVINSSNMIYILITCIFATSVVILPILMEKEHSSPEVTLFESQKHWLKKEIRFLKTEICYNCTGIQDDYTDYIIRNLQLKLQKIIKYYIWYFIIIAVVYSFGLYKIY